MHDPERRSGTAAPRASVATVANEAASAETTTAAAPVEAVVLTDACGVVASVNAEAERLLGASPEQLTGRRIGDLLDEPHASRVQASLDAALVSGAGAFPAAAWDVVVRRLDGRAVPAHLSVSELRVDGRHLLAWVVRDLGDVRRVEHALRQSNRRKDEFLAMLAHELRNPMAPIRNALHLLRLRADPSTVDRMREMMERQLVHLGRLVDDLLDVSRLGRGTIALERQRIDLGRTVRVCAEDHRRVFEQARIELLVDVPSAPVWIAADAARLAQVLGNLLANVRKVTPAGGSVWVELRPDVGADRAVVTVRDNGAGIPADVLPHVFELATDGGAIGARRGGLGLELVMARGLVELHGGRLEAYSDGPGTGSEFRITLPVLAPHADPQPASEAAPRVRRRVLVVEDNADAAESVRMLLEMFGYDVTVTYSGHSGVETAKRVRPDAVVCDIGLPGMDGYAVAAALRGHPSTSGARLIALTGYGQADDRRRAFAAGFDEHLTKPVDPQALLDRLAAVA